MKIKTWEETYKWQAHDLPYWPPEFKFLWPRGDEKLHGDIQTVKHLEDVVFPLIPEPIVAVQAGGAMGMWAKRMAQVFSDVYTFEPNPQSFYCCSFNTPEENVHCYNAALGNERKMIRVASPNYEINYGANRVVGDGPVPTLRVDDLGLSRCDLLMLDIEGYELFALQGAFETIKKSKPVIVLEDKGCSTEFGYQKGKVEMYLRNKQGYKTHKRFHGGRDVILMPTCRE